MDLFTYLEYYLTKQVYRPPWIRPATAEPRVQQVTPGLGRAFWISAWTALGWMSIYVILIAFGMVLRFKRKRLSFVIYDGAVTRIDHRVVVPLLWCAQALRESPFATF